MNYVGWYKRFGALSQDATGPHANSSKSGIIFVGDTT